MKQSIFVKSCFLALGGSSCNLDHGTTVMGEYPYFFGTATYECYTTSLVLEFSSSTVLAAVTCLPDPIVTSFGVFAELSDTAVVREM